MRPYSILSLSLAHAIIRGIAIIWGVIASILCLFSLAHAVYGMIGMIGAIVGIAWASITGMLVCGIASIRLVSWLISSWV